MSNKPFHYQAPFPLKKDDTEYYLLTSEHVSVSEFEGQEILKVAPEALTLLARQAFHDASFMLRPAHQQQVADILRDPEASENDKYVALQFLRNSDIAAKGVLPTCQDTGTAIIVGKKGQRVWTGGGDEAALARGVYNTYIEDNLRYSQNAPLDMYKEVNTGTNLPAQIDLYAVDGDEYKFLCIAKGGGSANKTYLYQETKALLTPGKLKNYLVEKMRTLGTAACPPYHIAFVIGGTSAETNLKTVKLASAKYYDELPTEGNEHGQAFRDVELEKELLIEAQNLYLNGDVDGFVTMAEALTDDELEDETITHINALLSGLFFCRRSGTLKMVETERGAPGLNWLKLAQLYRAMETTKGDMRMPRLDLGFERKLRAAMVLS